MIVFEKQGNIFDSTLDALVCPVNTVGVMGKGLALQFKEQFPGLERSYRNVCYKTDLFARAGFFVWSADPRHKVVCVPSKRHWRYPSKLEWVDRSLFSLAQNYDSHGIQSMAVPAVGCGEGGLEWQEVRKLIHEHFGEHHPLPVGIYCP